MRYAFQQVDVFSAKSCMGNPVAVFLESEGITTENMQRIAQWTNLSETTFVSASEKADYKVRIFTPSCELPFAGHPTLGTAWALRKAGRISKDHVVQECAFGLINIQFEGGKVFFELPHYTIEELNSDAEISHALQASSERGQLVTTGPRWVVAELAKNQSLSNINVNTEAFLKLMRQVNATGITVYSIAQNQDVHLRSFFENFDSVVEDPVCGSGNAAVGVHIMKTGNATRVGSQYEAFQGSAVRRDGRITVMIGDKIKVGGACNTVFEGTATFA